MQESTDILVFAPDEDLFDSVETALEPLGSSVIRARTAIETVKYLDDRRFGAVICPAAETTPEPPRFVELVHNESPSVPVVLVGTAPDTDSIRRAVEAGAAAHVEAIGVDLRKELTTIGFETRIRDELDRHNRLGRVVRELGQSLFTATTVDEVERLVYRRLSEAGLYQFIWVGAPGDDGKIDLHVPIPSTVAATEIPGIDAEAGAAKVDHALKSGSIEVVGDGEGFTRRVLSGSTGPDTDNGPGNDAGLTTAIVPFVGEGSVVGVGVFATERSRGIDSAEASVLETLSRLTGTAIWLVEARSELQRTRQRVEEFAGLIAHEIRNPLAIAMTQLDLLREGEDGQAIDRVDSSLQRIERHVENLVTLSRGLDIDDLTTQAIAETASAAWESLETPGAELVIESSRPLAADHDLLMQCFSNLFRNALEQETEGKTVVRLGSFDEGFYVADNGPGIPPEERERVFESGYSQSAGLGIGLTVVREICRVHGWSIEVKESREGGARFEIRTEGPDDNDGSDDRLSGPFDTDTVTDF